METARFRPVVCAWRRPLRLTALLDDVVPEPMVLGAVDGGHGGAMYSAERPWRVRGLILNSLWSAGRPGRLNGWWGLLQ